tara:strand:+ start:2227 stop:2328 length:102 start_codon:yes stop_codon:yes gene_type:complete
MQELAGYGLFFVLIVVNTSLHILIWAALDGDLD